MEVTVPGSGTDHFTVPKSSSGFGEATATDETVQSYPPMATYRESTDHAIENTPGFTQFSSLRSRSE